MDDEALDQMVDDLIAGLDDGEEGEDEDEDVESAEDESEEEEEECLNHRRGSIMHPFSQRARLSHADLPGLYPALAGRGDSQGGPLRGRELCLDGQGENIFSQGRTEAAAGRFEGKDGGGARSQAGQTTEAEGEQAGTGDAVFGRQWPAGEGR